jgi:hypothetical protein
MDADRQFFYLNFLPKFRINRLIQHYFCLEEDEEVFRNLGLGVDVCL